MTIPKPHSSPFQFPLELERDIFEVSARAHRGMAPQLVLVARRVQTWIDFILYETVAIFNPIAAQQFLRAVKTKPAAFFINVKTLLLAHQVEDEQVSQILPVCTGVVNLACWVHDSPHLPSIVSLRPQLLSLRHSVLSRSPDFSLPMYKDVTHLEFVNSQESWSSHSGFDLLPRLTHLALFFTAKQPAAADQLSRILTSCQTLQVFVVYKHGLHELGTGLNFVGDPRLVFSELPKHGRHSVDAGKLDMWLNAEAIVKTQLAELAQHEGPGVLINY